MSSNLPDGINLSHPQFNYKEPEKGTYEVSFVGYLSIDAVDETEAYDKAIDLLGGFNELDYFDADDIEITKE